MFFVYILALIGLGVLLAIAAVAVATILNDYPSESDSVDDPFDSALAAAGRLQAAAWTAVHELKGLEK